MDSVSPIILFNSILHDYLSSDRYIEKFIINFNDTYLKQCYSKFNMNTYTTTNLKNIYHVNDINK